MVGDEQWTRFEALGSAAIVAVSEPGALTRAHAAVERTVCAFDEACSRFRADSELSALNGADGRAVAVSPLLLEAVEAALRAARVTDGDVDPTVGQALLTLGYDRDFAALVGATGAGAPARPVPIASVPGWQTVTLDRHAQTIQMPREVRLDLGATAKALACDHAAAAARRAAGCGVLVSLGGDISVAGPAPQAGWRIRVTDDHRADVRAPGQWITITGGGVATSSTTTRRWRASTGWAHHLIDPQTGRPASTAWRTVSVAARSCLDANTASTAAIIRGERAVAWLQSLGLPSRLVTAQGAALHVAGWPQQGDDLSPADGELQ